MKVHPPAPHPKATLRQHLRRRTKALAQSTFGLIKQSNHQAGPLLTTLSTIATAIATCVYVHYAHKQLDVMSRQLLQMAGSSQQTDKLLSLTKDQNDLAKEANKQTHDLLTATQGAIFDSTVEYNQNIDTSVSGGTGKPSIDVFLNNRGKVPARQFSGEVTYIRKDKAGRIIQKLQHKFARDTIDAPGSDLATFLVQPSSTDLMAYATETFILKANIKYGDDFNKERTQTFCWEMAVTQKRGMVWVECGISKAWEQLQK